MGNYMSVPENDRKNISGDLCLLYSVSRFLKELQPDEKYHLLMGLLGLFINALTNMTYPRIVGLMLDSSELSGSYNLSKSDPYNIKLPFFSINKFNVGLASLSPDCSFTRILKNSLPIYIAGIFASWFRVYHTHTAIYLIQKRYRRQIFQKILSQNLLFFQSKTTNYFMLKLHNDCHDGPELFIECLTYFLRSCNSTLVGAYHLFSISSSLAMTILLSIPVLGVAIRFFGSIVKKYQGLKKEKLDCVIARAEEVISGIENVISFAKEEQEVDLFLKNLNTCDDIALKANSSEGLFMSSVLASFNISTLLMVYFGSCQIRSGALTMGNFTSFIIYGGFIGLGLSGFSRIYARLLKASSSMSNIYAIADLEENDDESLILEEVKGSLEIKNVTFRYPSRNAKVLQDISLKIEPKEVVAVVGLSGAGKTTLCKLLMTIYRPTHGEILVDSTDVRHLSSKWLRDSVFSVVPQEPVLFSATIAENMKYGNTSATDDQMIEAAKGCNIHEFIDSLPMKYETEVGPRGVMLSTGQRQRICLVRAILKNSPILIMDEPTSSLDGFSEELVTAAIRLTSSNKTLIIITHKPQILNKVNKVAVLNTTLEYFGSLEEAKMKSETFKSLFPNI